MNGSTTVTVKACPDCHVVLWTSDNPLDRHRRPHADGCPWPTEQELERATAKEAHLRDVVIPSLTERAHRKRREWRERTRP